MSKNRKKKHVNQFDRFGDHCKCKLIQRFKLLGRNDMETLIATDDVSFSFKVYALCYLMSMELIGTPHGLDSDAVLEDISYDIARGHVLSATENAPKLYVVDADSDGTNTKGLKLLFLKDVMELALKDDLSFSLKVYCAGHEMMMQEFAASHRLSPHRILMGACREIAKKIS